jgi:superoxide reductase
MMPKIGDLFKTEDWKKEKHVPIIECPDEVPSGNLFRVNLSLGKEVPHPNTTEHHIRWIELFFKPEGDKFACQVGHFAFAAHGESTEGPNTGPVHTHHSVMTEMQVTRPGALYASAFCNIHGLWESSRAIKVT